MRLRSMAAAVVAILAISFSLDHYAWARGPARQAGRAASPATRALAARIAAQNPQLTAQQAIQMAGTFQSLVTASRVTPSNPGLAAQLIAQNPQLTAQQAVQQAGQLNAQQASLLATYYGGAATASQLMASNNSRAALAAQIAGQNPQFTAQQATLLANSEVNAIATQQAAQIAARNPQLTPQQATLLASYLQNTGAIATQLRESSSARTALAAQIAAQNPQLTAQQAALLANNEINATAAQLAAATTPYTSATTTPNTTPSIPGGVFPSFPALTPGFAPPIFPGNGEFPPGLPTTDEGGGVAGVPQTAPGAALQGAAQVIGAAGQFDLGTAAGAVNMTQAQSNEMRNQVQRVQTFYDLRAAGREGRETERGSLPTAEEFARRARVAAPHGLSAEQIDPGTGTLHWPESLRHAEYDTQRRRDRAVCGPLGAA